jgi:hypothetical protein
MSSRDHTVSLLLLADLAQTSQGPGDRRVDSDSHMTDDRASCEYESVAMADERIRSHIANAVGAIKAVNVVEC